MIASGWTLVCPSVSDGDLPLSLTRTVDGGAVEQIPFELEDGDDQVDDETEPAMDPNPTSNEPATEAASAEDPATEAGEPEEEQRRDSKGRKLSRRATADQRLTRINDVYVALIQGASRQDILNSDDVKAWGVTERQFNDYLLEARKQFEGLADYVKKEEFGKALARLNDLYGRFFANDDFGGCLSVQRELAQLLGLNEAKPAPAIQINSVKIGVLLDSQAWREIKAVLVDAFRDDQPAMVKLQGALTAYAARAEQE